MKKLVYTLLITVSIFGVSCQTNDLEKITSGVKVIGKCCNKINNVATSINSKINTKEDANEEGNKNDLQMLPTYSWDGKMMLK